MSSTADITEVRCVDAVGARCEMKIRPILSTKYRHFWFLITHHSAILYHESTRKAVFIFPQGFTSSNLAHGNDGSFTLYGLMEDGVVSFNITPWVKSLRHKEKATKKKKKMTENTDQSSSKRRKKAQPESGNDDIFQSLLPSSDTLDESVERMDAQNGLESLFHVEVIYLEGEDFLLKGKNLVDCLLLDEVLVTLSHHLGEYVVSVNLCLGRGKPDLALLSQVLFSQLLSTDISLVSPELQEPSKFFSEEISWTSKESTAMVNVCATKLVPYSEAVMGAANSESICHEFFIQMFGIDSDFLESEVVIVGAPDGKILSYVLKGKSTYPGGSGDNANLFPTQRIVYDLEEPVVLATSINFILDYMVGSDSPGNNALLFLGRRGKICVTFYEESSQGEDKKVKAKFEERSIKGPVFSPVLLKDNCLLYSNGMELVLVKLEFVERHDGTSKQRNLQVTSVKYPVRNVACLARLEARHTEDGAESKTFMTCSTDGKVKSVTIGDLHQSQSTTSVTSAQAGQKMKELMLSIHDASMKINNYHQMSKQQNSVLSELTKAGHLARLLFDTSKEAAPFFVEVRCILQDNGSEKEQIVECKMTNRTKWTFGHEWSVCASIGGKAYGSPRQSREHGSDRMTCFSSKPANFRTYKLDNLKPDMFTVFHFAIHGDSSQLTQGPYEVKVYLHFELVMMDCLPGCLEGRGGDTGIMLPVCSKRIDILHMLRPVSDSAKQLWTNVGNQQNTKLTQLSSVAMDTNVNQEQDWLSNTLKKISEEKMIVKTKSEGSRKGQDVLRTTALLLNTTTLANLNLQGITFVQWLFKDNHPVLSILESECCDDSIQLMSPSRSNVQVIQTSDDEDASKTKIQVYSSNCQLLAEVWEAIHFRLSNSIEDTEFTSQHMTKGKEEQAKLSRSVQILENHLGEIRDQLPFSVEENQEVLCGIYEEMRKLSLRL